MVRALVQIDRSPDHLDKLSSFSEPEFVSDKVWLRKLVDGRAELFYWSNGQLDRYFYRLDEGATEPLICRRFRVGNTGVQGDERYRAALGAELRCSGGNLPPVGEVEFTKNGLLEYVTAFNACADTPQELLTSRVGPRARLALRIGVETHSLKYHSTAFGVVDGPRTKLETAAAPRLGVEIELPMEFTNRRWSLFSGLNYRQYQPRTFMTKSIDYSVDCHSVELALGTRLRLFDFGRSSYYLMSSSMADLPFKGAVLLRGGRPYRSSLRVRGGFCLPRNLLDSYRYSHLVDKGLLVGIAYRR